MSDAYDIKGVKITPAAGGYYDLAHASLPDGTERVRGKEKADERAEAIAKAAEKPEGSMAAQGDLAAHGDSHGGGGDLQTSGLGATADDVDKRTPAEKVQENNAGIAPPPAPPTPAEPPVVDPAQAAKDAEAAKKRDEELDAEKERAAALEGELAEMKARLDKLTTAAEKVSTVIAEAEPDMPAVPMTAPREYRGQMEAKTKAALKKAGIEITTIVLEENENIPPTGLFVGHNGRSYMIAPGDEVDVPNFLLEVLDNAVMSAPVIDSKSQKVLGYRDRSRYPYRVVKD